MRTVVSERVERAFSLGWHRKVIWNGRAPRQQLMLAAQPGDRRTRPSAHYSDGGKRRNAGLLQ